MGKIWLKSPDPNAECCGCEGKVGPCDNCTPDVCSCALLIPGGGNSFASLVIAQSELTNHVTDCNVYHFPAGGSHPTEVFSISYPTNGFTVESNISSIGSSFVFTLLGGAPNLSINLKAGSILTINYEITTSLSFSRVHITVKNCDGTTINDFEAVSGAGTHTVNIPTTDEYIIILGAQGQSTVDISSGTTSYSFEVVSNNSLTINPVIPQYIDLSSTTRLLDPCLEFELMSAPGLPTISVLVFSNLSAAILAIQNQVSNCIGYFRNFSSSTDTFSANDLGSSISLHGTRNLGIDAGVATTMSCSLNLQISSILSIDYNIIKLASDFGTPQAKAYIYDNQGNLLENFSATGISGASSPPLTGTFTSAPLPYSGRYIIWVSGINLPNFGSGGAKVDSTFVISSSDTLSIYEAVALYANGANCPSRIRCEDVP